MDRRIALHLGRYCFHISIEALLQAVCIMCMRAPPTRGSRRMCAPCRNRRSADTSCRSSLWHGPLPLCAGCRDTDARNAAGHAGEIFRTHGAAQAHGFKVQPAAIGGDDRNPHLGHDLQQSPDQSPRGSATASVKVPSSRPRSIRSASESSAR